MIAFCIGVLVGIVVTLAFLAVVRWFVSMQDEA